MPDLADISIKKIDQLLGELGIETYAMMFRDPDTGDSRWMVGGSVTWRVGACSLLRARDLRDALAQDKQEA